MAGMWLGLEKPRLERHGQLYYLAADSGACGPLHGGRWKLEAWAGGGARRAGPRHHFQELLIGWADANGRVSPVLQLSG